MIGVATTVELSPTGTDGGDFDVFSSLRDGTIVGENFSSGIGETVADGASQFDLVAVAGGEAELDTFMDDSIDLKDMPAPVDALSLAGKSEINSSENRMSDERRAAICQGVASAACASCAARDDCPILRMRNFANENLQPAPKRESYLRDLLSDDDDGIVVAGYANPDSGADLTNADIAETSDDKTDKLIEQVAPPNQGNEIFANETTESSDEPADVKEPERSFFEPTTTSEAVVGGSEEIREVQQENVSEASVNTSGEEHFTEPTEESCPSIEIKQQTSAIVSDTADKENEQPAFESPDIPTQTKTRTVLSSPGASEDIQTGDENRNPLKNETVYPMANEDKAIANVVEKEENLVIAVSKSANSEPSRAVENDESATPVSEQQHLVAHFDAVKADKFVTIGPIDNSGTKVLADAQSSELNIDAAADYNNFVESIDSVNAEQPKHVTPTAANVPLPQAQENAVNVSAEYETNETSTKKMVNAAELIPAKEQPDRSVIVSLSTQDAVEYGENLFSVDEEFTADHGPTRPDVVNKPTTYEVIEVAHETNESVGLEAMKIAPPVDASAVSEGKNQIDLPPELSEELVVDKRVSEEQILLAEQCYHNDAAVECEYGDDNKAWAEEDRVFFVEQQSPAVEPEMPSAEAVAVALPEEVITAHEEVDDLKLSVDNDSNSVGWLDNSKAASVPEITKGYDSKPAEQVVISIVPAVELIPDAELDKVVEAELGAQNDLAVASTVDNYGYNSETGTVSDNILIVNNHPPSGLWMDDSRLNPEEEDVATIQSGADDTSLVSRLVGVLVVALCVARGRRARAIVSSR